MMMNRMEEASGSATPPGTRPTYGYYRQPNGWITVSPVTELEELKYRREGWERLRQYGAFDMSTVYAANHPLEQLFLHGGAHELSRDQIIKSRLHLNPPLIPVCGQTLGQFHKIHAASCWIGARRVEFPQITEADMVSFPCHFCDSLPFPTEEARSQHESVAHREEKSDIRTGETLAASLLKGFSAEPARVPSATSTISPDTVAPSSPYLCGVCHAGFSHPMQLAKHVKSSHK